MNEQHNKRYNPLGLNIMPLFVASSAYIDRDTIKKAKEIGFDLVIQAPLN